jgi:hypothetical protein
VDKVKAKATLERETMREVIFEASTNTLPQWSPPPFLIKKRRGKSGELPWNGSSSPHFEPGSIWRFEIPCHPTFTLTAHDEEKNYP